MTISDLCKRSLLHIKSNIVKFVAEMRKKNYIKPELNKVDLDRQITLQMQTQPQNPTPRSGTKGEPSDPFESPFDNNTF